jgi:Tfp pilus assembly protein FimV
MARTRVRWGRVGALLAGTGVAVMVAGSAAHAGGAADPVRHATRPAVRTYVVHSGDTLWAIASRLAGPQADPRPVLDELVRVNDLDGTLATGMRLTLPA